MSIISAVKNNYGKYLAKGAGGFVLYSLIKDAHTVGKLQSEITAQSRDANICTDFYENSQRLTSPSITKSRMKDRVFKFQLASNWLTFINSGIGYFSGFVSSLVSHVIPIALGTTALLAKNKKIACGSGIALGAVGVITFIKDGLGLGTTKFLQK